MIQNLVLSLWMMCGMITPASPDGEGISFSENEKWESVLQRAEQEDKLIFMDCYTSWCGPCKLMSKEVFTLKTVGDFFNARFVNVKYDMEKGEGKRLKERYAAYVSAYPTLLLIDREGKVVQQLVGYQDSVQLLQGMKDGMEGRSVFAYRQEYAKGKRDLNFLKAYTQALENALCEEEACQVAVRYMDSLSLEQLREEEVWQFIRPYLRDPYIPQFEYVLYHLDYYWRDLKEDRYRLERQMAETIRSAVELIVRKNTDEEGHVLPLVDEPEKLEKLRRYLRRESFPGTGLMLAKMRIHELKLQQEWEKMYTTLLVARDMGILYHMDYYLNENIEYMAQYATDTLLLQKSLTLIEELQAKGDQDKRKLFRTNFYPTLALLHERLGHARQARECKLMGEHILKENQERYHEISKRK